MHLSSETVGSLAAALARAQQELKNPEKSLTAVMPAASAREKDRSFRYASLASGLDIIRKSLGRQEIAAIQTTAIDKDVGLVRLTTVLAHSSGEWVSSEWPVCPVADAADPQRMGAALTYARRYAIFTLVGIAGEDDLDATDPSRMLNGGHPASIGAPSISSATGGGSPKRANGSRAAPSVLGVADSDVLRDALLAELSGLASIEGLTEWAHRRLPAKNTLQINDALAVEEAFRAKLDACSHQGPRAAESREPEPTGGRESAEATSSNDHTEAQGNHNQEDRVAHSERSSTRPADEVLLPQSSRRLHRNRRASRASEERSCEGQPAGPAQTDLRLALERSLAENLAPTGAQLPTTNEPAQSWLRERNGTLSTAPVSQPRTAVDKSALLLQEPRRLRHKEHLRYVASQPCLLCSAKPSDAHHVRFAQPKALGRKVSDEFAVPLCRQHHRDLHQSGNEAAWWHDLGIDPIEVARQLWEETTGMRN